MFFLPKYDWENCFGGFSSLDQNSNLNLTPAIWSINNYNYPGTTCIITIICQFFFETSKKKFIHQIAGVRLRLEFWSKLEKPPKQFSQSYFGKKNKVETLFSGQNLEIPWVFLAFLLIFLRLSPGKSGSHSVPHGTHTK